MNTTKLPPLPTLPLLTRRQFGQSLLLGATALAAPLIIPSRLLRGDTAPSNRIRLALIGCGRQGRGPNVKNIFGTDMADFVALCDVDSRRLTEVRTLLETLHKEDSRTLPEITLHGNYRELLGRKDIDAFVICTPDHWHAEIALAAVLAGKDVYVEKPFTYTHAEGVLIRDAVQKTDCIFQVGSQQRSYKHFRQGCEFVRSGRVGRLLRVEVGLPTDSSGADKPAQPVPSTFDYDQWLGPAPFAYYNEQRTHMQNDPDRPGWLRCEPHCLGMITGWGAHHVDIAHWGMDMESTGPLKIEGTGRFPPPERKIYTVHTAPYSINLEFPGGIQMRIADAKATLPLGVRFIGEDGWIFVARGSRETAGQKLKALDASRPELLDPKGVTVKLTPSDGHHDNWLNSVRSRKQPISPPAIVHRSNTTCILSWIAMKLKRPLKWDPKAERFINDDKANAMLTRAERGNYGAFKYMAAHEKKA